MFKYLEEQIKNMKGNVLAIGIDEKLIKSIKKNDSIEAYEISRCDNVSFFSRKRRLLDRRKTVNIKRLPKYFNKKSIDYIICDFDQITKYYKYVFRDSIKLNRGKIYYYAKNEIDMDYVLKYKRYKSKIEVKEYEKTKLIIIDNRKAKTNIFKNIIFYISDTFCNFIDFISNIMVG